jgi:hypothetical protein
MARSGRIGDNEQCRLRVRSGNPQSEHSESAFPPKADVRADIASCRLWATSGHGRRERHRLSSSYSKLGSQLEILKEAIPGIVRVACPCRVPISIGDWRCSSKIGPAASRPGRFAAPAPRHATGRTLHAVCRTCQTDRHRRDSDAEPAGLWTISPRGWQTYLRQPDSSHWLRADLC